MKELKIFIVANVKVRKKEELNDLVNAVHALTPDTIFFIGWPGLHPANLQSSLQLKHYLVTSPHDDILITKFLQANGSLLDGKYVFIKGITVAGIGGLNPLQNLRKVLSAKEIPEILLTYHPPYGCGDLIRHLGVRRGLPELHEVIKTKKPRLHISSGSEKDECRINSSTVLTLPEKTGIIVEASKSSLLDWEVIRLP